MNILIFGGNRYFGKLLVKKLSKKKSLNIYLINRAKKKNIKKKNITLLKTDRNNITFLKKKIANIKFNFVIDNSAYNVKSVSNFYNNFKKNIGHYIFSSSVMTYLDTSLKIIAKEKDVNKSKSLKLLKLNYNDYEIKYAINKKKVEKYITNNFESYTIFRIHNVIGKNDFSKKTKKLMYFNLNNLNLIKIDHKYIQICYVDDLVNCFMKIIGSTKTKKKNIYNVSSKPISLINFFNIRDKYFKEDKSKKKEEFPLPLNNLIDNTKISTELNIRFSGYNKIIKSLLK